MASPGPERTVEQGGSGHPRVVVALLVVATLIAFLAVFSIWVNRETVLAAVSQYGGKPLTCPLGAEATAGLWA